MYCTSASACACMCASDSILFGAVPMDICIQLHARVLYVPVPMHLHACAVPVPVHVHACVQVSAYVF